ncbi:hypothetical protein [Pseudomonas rhodesiae]|uniref:hypothetical protein n=1 Tax=Pseudomonas rhodesiae TaxID=76760 RepID=UPI0028A88949|nr:hypothetical protein [Pseudomonas rhodesiae]
MNTLKIDISSLIAEAQKSLVDAEPCPIGYSDRQELENNRLPPSLGTSPVNIYALWKREEGKTWQLMYIGQRSFKSGWSRIAEHLFKKSKSTQSKLLEVRAVIESGAEIGITAILVEPDSMRLAIEEKLINRNSMSAEHLIWNLKGRTKLPKVGTRRNTV